MSPGAKITPQLRTTNLGETIIINGISMISSRYFIECPFYFIIKYFKYLGVIIKIFINLIYLIEGYEYTMFLEEREETKEQV